MSPSLKPLPTTKPRQTAGRAAQRKIAEPKTTTTRRKKAAIVADLPSIIESPVKSPPGAFPNDSPPRSSTAHYTTSLALTPAHLSTATKRAHDSSTDRSVESYPNLSLFKRARTDDWTPSKQLLGSATAPASNNASPVADHTVGNEVVLRNASPSPSHNTSSDNNQISDAVVSSGSAHSSPATDGGSTPVAHGLFARVKSFIPSLSARASRVQKQDEPVEVTSPTPAVNNFTSPVAHDLATSQATKSPVASTTPTNAPASARSNGLHDFTTPEYLKSTKRSGFHYTPKHAMPNNNDDAGYESDEYRDIIDSASVQRAPSASARKDNRAYIRKLEKDMAEKKAAEAFVSSLPLLHHILQCTDLGPERSIQSNP